MTAPYLVCGLCGTELPSNAKSYNESAVPSYPLGGKKRVVTTRDDTIGMVEGCRCELNSAGPRLISNLPGPERRWP
jgi:hypothetical protein